MTTHTGASNSTFADVLTKLVTEEQVTQTAKNLDFSMGCLCKVCKDVVSTLDRLQQELFDVKSLILGWIANIEHFDEKNMVAKKDTAKAEVTNQNLPGKIKKINGSTAKRGEKELTEEECSSISKGKNTPQKEATNGHGSQNIIIKSKRTTKDTPKFKDYKTAEKNIASERDKLITTDDEVYNVEALLEKRGYKYLVKWENYPEFYNSWEPRFGLPEHIVKVLMHCIFLYNIVLSC
jgi:thiol-disulfide isomerase/thioredoxin